MRTSILGLFALAGAACSATRSGSIPGAYLYMWAGDSAGEASDFLAVIDADPASKTYGAIVGATATGEKGTHPHHTEAVVGPNHHLLANGFLAGKTWLFDLSDARAPTILTFFGDVGRFGHPHAFFRMADGSVLATFQYKAGEPGSDAPMQDMAVTTQMLGKGKEPAHTTGGLVLMDERGAPIRSASATDPTIADTHIYPYSVVPIPAMDRAVSTTSDMDDANTLATSQWVQIWRLSDLTLLRSIAMPPGPRGIEQFFTGEPFLLGDGGSVLIHTFNCGVYLVRGIDTDEPTSRFVYGFDSQICGVPIVTGHWWLQTTSESHALIALDLHDPEHPREVSRVSFGDDEFPHWIAIDPTGRRIVLNSASPSSANRLYVVDFDPSTGRLAIDEQFRDPGSERPGIHLSARRWPHGWTGTASPHGTVFSRE